MTSLGILCRLLIATDEHILIHVDIGSAFDSLRGVRREPAVSVVWQIMGSDC